MPKLFLSPWSLDFSGLKIPKIMDKVPSLDQKQIAAWSEFLSGVGAGDQAIQNAISIGTHNDPAVISGQQIGLGISPILSLFKIFAIENLASYLSKKLTRNVAPIFWLQTEDHDLAEILTVNLLDKNFDLNTFTAEEIMKIIGFGSENRRSVGGISIESFVPTLIKMFEEKFLNSKKSLKFNQSFEQGGDLVCSFAKYYYSIFPDSNVAFFDIRNDAFKTLKSEVFLKALDKQETIESLLKAQSIKIESLGKAVQVKIRDNSPLFFYHPTGPQGDRYRLTKVKDNYFVEETGFQISFDELRTELISKPENFSSSALLRPLLQDSIFNTLIYVGGAAEISYLEQIEPLYREFDLQMPNRLQRPSGVIVDEKSVKHFAGLEANDFFKGKEYLLEKLINQEFQGDLNPQQLKTKIDKNITQIEELLVKTLEVESTLENPKLKTISTLNKSINRFMDKYKLALVRKEAVLQGRIKKLMSQAYPGDRLQERVLSAYSLELLYGESVFSELHSQFNEFFKENMSDILLTI